MAYPATTIAEYLLHYCTSIKRPISNLKLQKMLYFLWVDYYKATGRYLYHDEVCAWQLGPVVPSVYYEYSSYAGQAIEVTDSPEIGENDRPVIDNVIEKYLNISASTLVNRTHEEGRPWSQIYKNGVGLRQTIPFPLIIRLECRD